LSAVPPPPLPPPPTSNLVGWWKFDEGSGNTAADSSGNKNHGTLHGNPRWVTGHDGSALSFDGVNDYVEIPDDDSLTPSSKITISFWINNRGGVRAGIYKWGACPDSRAHSFQIADKTNIVFASVYEDTMTYGEIYSNGSVSKNRWHHLALTFNRGNVAIYINGQLDKSALMSISSITNDDQPLTIGGYWSYCDEKFLEKALNGIVDELMIFDRALSVEEIQKLFREH